MRKKEPFDERKRVSPQAFRLHRKLLGFGRPVRRRTVKPRYVLETTAQDEGNAEPSDIVWVQHAISKAYASLRQGKLRQSRPPAHVANRIGRFRKKLYGATA